MTVTKLPSLLTVNEAVAALHQAAGGRKPPVSSATMRREIKEGKLRARRIGRVLRILDDDLAEWARGAS